jgi:hypothetical protein
MSETKSMWNRGGGVVAERGASLTPEHDRLGAKAYEAEVIRNFVAWLFASDPSCRSGYPWSQRMVDEEILRYFEADFAALANEERDLQMAVETAVREEVARCIGHK